MAVPEVTVPKIHPRDTCERVRGGPLAAGQLHPALYSLTLGVALIWV